MLSNRRYIVLREKLGCRTRFLQLLDFHRFAHEAICSLPDQYYRLDVFENIKKPLENEVIWDTVSASHCQQFTSLIIINMSQTQNKKYLLYIDILGFSKLVEENSQKIEKLFDIINNLNVHKHYAFQTIVFSDTILCYNSATPTTKYDNEYIVMHACEFVQDLMYKSADLDIPFRAVLTYGEFSHEKLSYIDKYYGKALIDAYNKEKEINGMGLFIYKDILEYNTIYRTTCFDHDLHFVYLMQGIEGILPYVYDIPVQNSIAIEGMDFFKIKSEVKVLKTIKKNINNTQLDSKIRGKYLQTYYLYQQQYGDLIDILEKNNFDYQIISSKVNWAGI